jgi:hypothetical protein
MCKLWGPMWFEMRVLLALGAVADGGAKGNGKQNGRDRVLKRGNRQRQRRNVRGHGGRVGERTCFREAWDDAASNVRSGLYISADLRCRH